MDRVSAKLTVYFEDPFWVGVIECEAHHKLEVSRIVFGAEPKDTEIYAFLLTHWNRLHFSPPVNADRQEERHINPKRMQRIVSRQINTTGTGTKAQQALKAEHDQNAVMRKSRRHEKREEDKQHQFELKTAKRKEKHRGH
ncbi:MAG: YjdF family protein [Eubacteriaceae bacterium]|jgi:hypothetical protein